MPSAAPTLFAFSPTQTLWGAWCCLHGWGADADDLLMLGEALAKRTQLPLELVALPAPEPHPQGVGRQWYGLFPSRLGCRPQRRGCVTQPANGTRGGGSCPEPHRGARVLPGAAMALSTGCDLPLPA